MRVACLDNLNPVSSRGKYKGTKDIEFISLSDKMVGSQLLQCSAELHVFFVSNPVTGLSANLRRLMPHAF